MIQAEGEVRGGGGGGVRPAAAPRRAGAPCPAHGGARYCGGRAARGGGITEPPALR